MDYEASSGHSGKVCVDQLAMSSMSMKTGRRACQLPISQPWTVQYVQKKGHLSGNL